MQTIPSLVDLLKQTVAQLKEELGLYEVPACLNTDSFEKALNQLKDHHSSALCVVGDGGELEGVIGEKDLISFRFCEHFSSHSELKNFMTSNPWSLKLKESTLSDVLNFFKRHNVRTLILTDESFRPVYILTTLNLLKLLTRGLEVELSSYGVIEKINILEIQAQEEGFSSKTNHKKDTFDSSIFTTPTSRLLSKTAIKLDKSTGLDKAVKKMSELSQHSIVVVEYETCVLGIVTERDLIRSVLDLNNEQLKELSLEDVMTPRPRCVLARHQIGQALNTMYELNCRQLIVVDEDKHPVGILHLLDIISFIANSLQGLEGRS